MSNLIIRLKREKYILSIVLILIVFLGVSHCLLIGNVSLFITMIIIVISLFSTVNISYIIMFMCLPFFNMMNKSIGSVSFFYVVIIIFLIKFLKYKKMKIGYKKLLLICFFIFLRLFSRDLVLLSKWILLILPLILTYNDDILYYNLERVIKYLSITTIISSLFGYYMLINGLSIYTSAYVYSEKGITTRFAGLIGDSVVYGQFIIIIIASNIVIGYFNKKINKRCILLSVILSIFGILTYSKTFIILLIFIIFIYILNTIMENIKNKKKILKSFFIIISSIFVILLGISYIIKNMDNYLINNYIVRFSNVDLWTGRGTVSKHYIDLIFSDFRNIFIPMKQYIYEAPFYASSTMIITRAHNIYIETVCIFGLAGSLLIFLYIIFEIIKFLFRKGKFICLSPLMVLLASGISLHGHLEFQYYFTVMLSLFFISPKFHKYANKSDNIKIKSN